MTDLLAAASDALVEERPVFLLASGQRTGSTLLQRLLNSSPRVLVWGEQLGELHAFERSHRRLRARGSAKRWALEAFLRDGHDQWIPNLLPRDEELLAAARLYVAGLFALPALRLGRPLWGFKEVRYSAKLAVALQELFPEARVVHVTRDPVDCLLSAKRWESAPSTGWTRRDTASSLGHWRRVNRSFLRHGGELRHLFPVRLEDAVSDPAGLADRLAAFLELPAGSLDAAVFERRLDGVPPGEGRWFSRDDLDGDDRRLLAAPGLVEVAAAYGYDLAGLAR